MQILPIPEDSPQNNLPWLWCHLGSHLVSNSLLLARILPRRLFNKCLPLSMRLCSLTRIKSHASLLSGNIGIYLKTPSLQNNTEHVFFKQISQQTLFGHCTRTQTLPPKDFGHKVLQNTCRITAIVVGDYQLQRGTRNTHQIFLQSHSQLVKCGKTKRMQISL